jgi:hypothetical protein
MLRIHEFLSTSTVILRATDNGFAASVESEIERIWQAEQQRRGVALFNGRILSAIEVSPQKIEGRVAQYRHLIAQRAHPELFDVLQVRPVAVSGLFECSDGIVFGRRSAMTTQDAGLWELAPSGGIDTGGLAEETEIDYRAQILTELHEEIGISSDSVSSVTPFCLVENLDSHVLDIALRIEAPISANAVLEAHRRSATREYDELRIVHRDEIDEFIRDKASQLVAVSAVLIEQSRKLKPL